MQENQHSYKKAQTNCQMRKCCVNRCRSTLNDENISFHQFPKNEERQKKWIAFCGEGISDIPICHRYICSKHFKKIDFKNSFEAYGLTPMRVTLHNTAVPSILPIYNTKQSMAPFTPSSSLATTSSTITSSFNKEATLLQKVQELTLQNEQLLEKNNFLMQSNEHFKSLHKKVVEINKDVTEKIKHACRRPYSKEMLAEFKAICGNLLTDKQLYRLITKKKKTNWDTEDIFRAFTIRYFSLQAYNYLRTELEPDMFILRQWAQGLNSRGGILHDAIKMMKIVGGLQTELEKITILQFDRMDVKYEYEIDKLEDEIVGPHEKMLVCCVQGLFSEWQQPIYAEFDLNMSTELLIQLVIILHQIGYNVVGVASTDISCLKALGFTEEHTYFLHPVDEDKKIHMFSDASYSLKLIKQHLLDGHFTDRSTGAQISIEPLEQLLKMRSEGELTTISWLSSKHLECEETGLENLKLARELLSRETVEALRKYIHTTDSTVLADFIELVSNWFDILNFKTTSAHPGKYKKQFENAPYQTKVLNAMIETMRKSFKTKRTEQNSPVLFQSDIIRTINSLQNLFIEMRKEFKIDSIVTYNVTMGALHNLFSQIQNTGRKAEQLVTTPIRATLRLKMIMLGKVPGHIKRDQTQVGNNNEVVVGRFLRECDITIDCADEEDVVGECDDFDTDSDISSIESEQEGPPNAKNEENGVEYSAVRLAKKFKTENNFWTQQCKTLEEHFNNFHNFEFEIKNNVVEHLTTQLQRRIPQQQIDHALINDYVVLRTLCRAKFLNKKIKELGKTDFKKLLKEKKKVMNMKTPSFIAAMTPPMMLVIENSGRIKLTNNCEQFSDTRNELNVPILKRAAITGDQIETKRSKNNLNGID